MRVQPRAGMSEVSGPANAMTRRLTEGFALRRVLLTRKRSETRNGSDASRLRRLRGDRGDVAPLVVVTPIMVFMVMLVIQMGLYFHARSVMSAAAQDAARTAQHDNGSVADAYLAADQILAGSGSLVRNQSVAVNQTETEVTVTIAGEVTSLVPFWQAQVSVAASGPRENFRPESDR